MSTGGHLCTSKRMLEGSNGNADDVYIHQAGGKAELQSRAILLCFFPLVRTCPAVAALSSSALKKPELSFSR